MRCSHWSLTIIHAIMKRLPLLLLLLLLAASTARAQTSDTIIRVCTWNVLNYSSSTDSNRTHAMQSVVRSIQPDILVVQDLVDSLGFTAFNQHIQQAGLTRTLSAAWVNGPDTDNAIFFDTTKVALVVGGGPIHTSLRDINHWLFVVKSTNDTLHIFGCQLTSGDTPADAEARFQEVLLLRYTMHALPFNNLSILCGDLSTYSASEQAYNQLIYIGGLPTLFADPINRPGDWHSDSSFADIHTQSTRVRRFGGGVSGGLDDRFDFVLLSYDLLNNYLPNSYTTFGNDGQHLNDSINALPNLAVPDSIAQALYDASDHLPVYLDLVFHGKLSGVDEEKGKPGVMDFTERRE